MAATGFEYARRWTAQRLKDRYSKPGQVGGAVSPRSALRAEAHETRKMLILTPGAKFGRRVRKQHSRKKNAALRAAGKMAPLPETPRKIARNQHCIHTEVAHISGIYFMLQVFMHPARQSNYLFHAYEPGTANTLDLRIGRFEASLLLADPTLPPANEWAGEGELDIIRRLARLLTVKTWGTGKMSRAALCIGRKQGVRGAGVNRGEAMRGNARADRQAAQHMVEKQEKASAAINRRKDKLAKKAGKTRKKRDGRRRSSVYTVQFAVARDWIDSGVQHANAIGAAEHAESVEKMEGIAPTISKYEKQKLDSKGSRRERRRGLMNNIKGEDGRPSSPEKGKSPADRVADEKSLVGRLKQVTMDNNVTASGGGFFRISRKKGGARAAMTSLRDIGKGAPIGGGTAKVQGIGYIIFTLHQVEGRTGDADDAVEIEM